MYYLNPLTPNSLYSGRAVNPLIDTETCYRYWVVSQQFHKHVCRSHTCYQIYTSHLEPAVSPIHNSSIEWTNKADAELFFSKPSNYT